MRALCPEAARAECVSSRGSALGPQAHEIVHVHVWHASMVSSGSFKGLWFIPLHLCCVPVSVMRGSPVLNMSCHPPAGMTPSLRYGCGGWMQLC